MKRFFTLAIVLLSLSGVFAQQSVDLDLQGTKIVQISLGGPAQTVPVNLLLKVTYQPEEELVLVEIKGDSSNYGSRVTPPKEKDKITHLLFPLDWTWNGIPYNGKNLKNYFKDRYQSQSILEKPIKNQIADTTTKVYRPAFEVFNGEIRNKSKEDILFSLKEGVIIKEIKVSDLKAPVQLIINNVIPFRAEVEESLYSNKFYLKYISDSYTITFNLPEDKCAGMYDLIRQYANMNGEMKSDLKHLKEFAEYNETDKNGVIQRQRSLIYKYKTTRGEINAMNTECEKLLEQFSIFNDYYNQLTEVNDLTLDSLRSMIKTLDLCRKLLQTANDGISCEYWKDSAKRYIADVDPDEGVFDPSSEAYDLVLNFKKLKEYIEEFPCPVKGVVEEPIDTVGIPPPPPPGPGCNFDRTGVVKAKKDIQDLFKERFTYGKNNKPKFNAIVDKWDSYIKSLSESCRRKNKEVIEEYEAERDAYKKRFK